MIHYSGYVSPAPPAAWPHTTSNHDNNNTDPVNRRSNVKIVCWHFQGQPARPGVCFSEGNWGKRKFAAERGDVYQTTLLRQIKVFCHYDIV